MRELSQYEVWFVTGSQHLYGERIVSIVEEHSRKMVEELSSSSQIPVRLIYKPVLTTTDGIKKLILEANASTSCVGIITWMHTFSPAKMWINGLKILEKPILHLHTQYNQEIPWSEIDMDFMNLNQSAHGDREFGFITARLRLNAKIVVGYWRDPNVAEELGTWIRAACGWYDGQRAKIARFGDNMRDVAVTEGDKVEAELRLGYSVNGYGLGDLVQFVESVKDNEVDQLIDEYATLYTVDKSLLPGGKSHSSLRDAAKIELGMRAFLQDGDFQGFTTTFENLHGLSQLPGLAVQRLMAEGYGFGAEGDWKTAALVRAMKVMGAGLPGGTSFMEDYTYHLDPNRMQVLGAHMLEVCPTIAKGKPFMEIHPLSIGGKDDPIRLVFDVSGGTAINVSIMDMGNRFRLVVNEVEVVSPENPLPKLPVARALWEPKPNLKVAAGAWILSGGAHHTCFSKAVTAQHIRDFAEIAGLEFVLIDGRTDLNQLKKELRWNEIYYGMKTMFN